MLVIHQSVHELTRICRKKPDVKNAMFSDIKFENDMTQDIKFLDLS